MSAQESSFSQLDQLFMAAALRLGLRHLGQTNENPSVGALIVDESQSPPIIIGRGVTAKSGRPHAEPQALAEAGERAKGATAYVTLEPCSHYGKTPPCAQALIDAEIGRVVIAYQDPDTRVDGKGIEMLKAAGVKVEQGCMSAEAAWNLRGFLTRTTHKRPHVHLKLAVSADFKLGREGIETAITGEQTRAQVHLMRAQSDAILVGANTVRVDDPSLNVRLAGMGDYAPHRFVVTKSGELPRDSQIFRTARQIPTTVVQFGAAENAASEDYVTLGVELLKIESETSQNSWMALLENLVERGISTLMVEGGAALATSLWASGQIDEVSLFQGPNTIGEPAVESPLNQTIIEQSGLFALRRTAKFGADILHHYARK